MNNHPSLSWYLCLVLSFSLSLCYSINLLIYLSVYPSIYLLYLPYRESAEFLSRVDVPESGGAVDTARGHHSALRIKAHTHDLALMALQRVQTIARQHIPHLAIHRDTTERHRQGER